MIMHTSGAIENTGILEALDEAAALIERVRAKQLQAPVNPKGRSVKGLKDHANAVFKGLSILDLMNPDVKNITPKAQKAFCAFETIRLRHGIAVEGVSPVAVAGLLAAEIWADRLEKSAAHASRGREHMKALNADPAFAAANAARMKARNADPAFAAANAARSSKTMKARNADPAFVAARDARMKALHADPAFKEKLIAGFKAYWAKKRGQNNGAHGQETDMPPPEATP